MEAAAGGADATAAAATARLQSDLYFSKLSVYLATALNIDKAPATVDTAADTAGTAASTRQTRKLADQALQGCPTSLDHHSCCRILLLLQSAKYRIFIAIVAQN